ncbi:hypothetical protein OCU04_011938 [Sclerotinia nivalis]|uniref:Uncharacterized protein n=1 Tax=Sclerotinia nivalis TaxID=352851 RepID=A0A9X0DDN1_9HELO|nr:hypothetical protein OCU04_011938 [Sclerotinia nivalis]
MSQAFGSVPPPPGTESPTRGVKALYIHCIGDQKSPWSTQIHRSHNFGQPYHLHQNKPTGISVHMRLPILTRKTEYVDPHWANKRGNIDYASRKYPMSDRKALYLDLPVDNNHESTWGFADMEKWDLIIGTVLVARQDKKDITAQQVEGLARFASMIFHLPCVI